MNIWMSFWTLVLIGVIVVFGLVTIWVTIRGLADIVAMIRQLRHASSRAGDDEHGA